VASTAGSRRSRSSASKATAGTPADRAWQYAVRLLAAHDRSTHEIRQRLEAFGATLRTVNGTVKRLHDLHYLDDQRFAHSAAAAAVRRGHGSERLRAELSAKGVADDRIDTAVAAAFADEPALARRVLDSRYPTPPTRPGERAKAARWLLQRGFPESVVLAILGEGC